MFKYCIPILLVAAVAGCKPVTDADSSDAIKLPPPKSTQLSPGSMADKTNPFVGSFGTKTEKSGISVKFGSDLSVTVDGQKVTAIGTYSPNRNVAEAVFPKTNVSRFDKTTFTLSADGKSISFLGPLATKVNLTRS